MELKFRKGGGLAKAPGSVRGRASIGARVSGLKHMLFPRPCLEPMQLGFLEGSPTHVAWKGHGEHEEDPIQTLTELFTSPR